MARKVAPKKLSSEQLTEIRKLNREGHSLSEIARRVGCHRQTVRMYLTEHKGDIISEEVRRGFLTETYRDHNTDLHQFTQKELKALLDASPPNLERRETGEKRDKGPIYLGGVLGVPNISDAEYMCTEWIRLYQPPMSTRHLTRALREHTPNSQLWEYWDEWRTMVADYETAGNTILQYIESKIEADLYEAIKPDKVERVRTWLFGNVLRLSVDQEHEDLGAFRRYVYDPKGAILIRDEKADADGSASLYRQLQILLSEIQALPEFQILKSASAGLRGKGKQLELKRIAKEIDWELSALELMRGFPGRCNLCPI